MNSLERVEGHVTDRNGFCKAVSCDAKMKGGDTADTGFSRSTASSKDLPHASRKLMTWIRIKILWLQEQSLSCIVSLSSAFTSSFTQLPMLSIVPTNIKAQP